MVELSGDWLQGTHVWLQEPDYMRPCTLGSCANGSMLFTSDYGEVSEI